jgi:hypothetical protein
MKIIRHSNSIMVVSRIIVLCMDSSIVARETSRENRMWVFQGSNHVESKSPFSRYIIKLMHMIRNTIDTNTLNITRRQIRRRIIAIVCTDLKIVKCTKIRYTNCMLISLNFFRGGGLGFWGTKELFLRISLSRCLSVGHL